MGETMNDHLSDWLKKVHDTQDVEIDCSACLDLVSDYVDFELVGEQAARRLPLVAQHLKQCAVCREEYHLLLDLAQMERDGDLPSREDLAGRLSGKQA